MTAPANCENCIVSNTRRKQFLLILCKKVRIFSLECENEIISVVRIRFSFFTRLPHPNHTIFFLSFHTKYSTVLYSLVLMKIYGSRDLIKTAMSYVVDCHCVFPTWCFLLCSLDLTAVTRYKTHNINQCQRKDTIKADLTRFAWKSRKCPISA